MYRDAKFVMLKYKHFVVLVRNKESCCIVKGDEAGERREWFSGHSVSSLMIADHSVELDMFYITGKF